MESLLKKLPFVVAILVMLILFFVLPFWAMLLAALLVVGILAGRAVRRRGRK